jgi:pimeloyl-ACP methyl ester carboxylesterase
MNGSFDGCRTASLGDVSLAYVEQGAGEPVIFVHGTVSDLRIWDKQVPTFAGAFRTIAYSRRYARPNPDIEPDADDQMSPHVDDLIAFMRALDIPSAHIVGHSWGGFVSLLAAIKYPQAVRSLVLMEPPVVSLFVSTPPKPSELLWQLIRRPRTAAAIIKFGATVIGPAQKAFERGDDAAGIRAFGHGVLGKKYFEGLSEQRKAAVWENRSSARAQILGAGFPPLRAAEVRGVRVPTLLVTGADSPAIMLRATDRLGALLANAERVEISGASHMMHVANPTAFNASVLGFLKRVA